MKTFMTIRFNLLICSLFLSGQILAQAGIRPSNLPSQKELFKNFQGLIKGDDYFFQGEGYSVSILRYRREPSKQNVKALAHEMQEEHEVLFKSWDGNPSTNYVIQRKNEKSGFTVTETIFYFTYESGIRAVLIQKIGDVDTAFEENIVASIFYDDVYTAICEQAVPDEDSMNFAGRKILMHPQVCQWQGPNIMQCSGYGEMNWDMYNSLKEAIKGKNQQIAINKARNVSKVIKEEKVPVIFEGIETVADKLTFKIKVPKLLIGRNIIIIYYVAVPVRGRFVYCVMSFYKGEEDKSGLAPFVNEVMQLKN